MQTGEEYKGEWGDTLLVLRYCEALKTVWTIDDLLYIEKFYLYEFLDKYKPTGRVNLALKHLWKEKNFVKINNTYGISVATPEGK